MSGEARDEFEEHAEFMRWARFDRWAHLVFMGVITLFALVFTIGLLTGRRDA